MITLIRKQFLKAATMLVFLLCVMPIYAQTDSLHNILLTTPNDSIKIQCYLKLADHYLNRSEADSTILYSQKGLELIKKAKLRPQAKFYLNLVQAYDIKREYRNGMQYLPPLIEIYENSKEPADQVRAMNYKGLNFYRRGEFNKALEAFEKTKMMAIEEGMPDMLAMAYLGLGRVYYNTGNTHEEEFNYTRYLELAEAEGAEKMMIYSVRSRIGDIRRLSGRIDEAIADYGALANDGLKKGDSLVAANALNKQAWSYYELGQLEKSLEIYLNALEISQQIGNKNLISNCLGNIGNIYRDWNYYEKAIEYYTLSIEVSKKIRDIYNLMWLYRDISRMYANMGRYELAYDNFVLHSAYNDTLMSDEYNRRLVQAQTQYEKEKTASELELIEMKLQRNNYLLYGLGSLSILVVLLAMLMIRTSRLRSKQRLEAMNNKISLLTQKNLRSQMNPHFIFNTLNSIQYYVFKNDRIASNNYMTKFAKLIRQTLENSEHPAIPINEEINALELYLELESLRFKEKFDWKINIDEDIDIYMYKIPTMLIQPYVENAIGHGLMNKEGKGYIHIGLKHDAETILCSIEDNGIGRKRAMEIKNNKNENHKSLGTSITESRLRLVNSLYGKNMKIKYTDMVDEDGNASGTRVEISIPIIT
ncbi:MAG: tetratricopeptide repeat protein [Bacteroidales bacterium]|nr:tetratricopeptide repeat protein [Bacteroidales bacterium]